jgi:hypothetical protein
LEGLFSAKDFILLVLQGGLISKIVFHVMKGNHSPTRKKRLQQLNSYSDKIFYHLKDFKNWLSNLRVSNTVQPCDTTQARSDSDFGIKVSSVQFYASNSVSALGQVSIVMQTS